MRSLGRGLQLLALALLPLGSVMQLSAMITLGQMLTMLVAGVCLFGIGWLLSAYSA
ncbi:MAG: hypothetical protein AB7O59_04950 [Pirellulales bacterium]